MNRKTCDAELNFKLLSNFFPSLNRSGRTEWKKTNFSPNESGRRLLFESLQWSGVPKIFISLRLRKLWPREFVEFFLIESFRSSAFVVLTFFSADYSENSPLGHSTHIRSCVAGEFGAKQISSFSRKAGRGINLNTSSSRNLIFAHSWCVLAYKSKIDCTQFFHDRSSLIKIKHAKSSIGKLTVDGWRLSTKRGCFPHKIFCALLEEDSFDSLLATQFVIVLMRISHETLLIAINCWKKLSSRAQFEPNFHPQLKLNEMLFNNQFTAVSN